MWDAPLRDGRPLGSVTSNTPLPPPFLPPQVDPLEARDTSLRPPRPDPPSRLSEAFPAPWDAGGRPPLPSPAAGRAWREVHARFFQDAKVLEEAGAFSVVLEKIPASLAKKITSALSIPTIGIGAGKYCDGQILVTPDMLALNVDFHPRFVRHYSKLAEAINKAVTNYISDVKKSSFPSADESF